LGDAFSLDNYMYMYVLELSLRHWSVTREMTQLRSQWARQNLLLQKRVHPTKSLGSKHTRRGVHSDFSSMAMLPVPWFGQVLDSKAMQVAN
jgi:hypothetical protein